MDVEQPFGPPFCVTHEQAGDPTFLHLCQSLGRAGLGINGLDRDLFLKHPVADGFTNPTVGLGMLKRDRRMVSRINQLQFALLLFINQEGYPLNAPNLFEQNGLNLTIIPSNLLVLTGLN